MARKNITKEVKRTIISPVSITLENGQPLATQLDPIVVMGAVTKEKANRLARKQHPDLETVVVDKLVEEVKVYEMSIEQFLQIATEKVAVEEA